MTSEVMDEGGLSLAIVVPAHNEEKSVGETVAALRQAFSHGRILVVDDGSTDRTAERASQAGAEVLRLERNKGKGAALAIGFRHVLDGKPDLILMIDGDLGRSALEAKKLVAACQNGADMSIAAFRGQPGAGTGGGFGLVKRLSRWAVRRFGGHDLLFPLSGQRAFRPELLDALGPPAAGWGVEIVFTIEALRHGYRVVEVETDMAHHVTGRDLPGFIHRGRQFWHILRAIGPYLWQGRPRGPQPPQKEERR